MVLDPGAICSEGVHSLMHGHPAGAGVPYVTCQKAYRTGESFFFFRNGCVTKFLGLWDGV